MRTFIISILTFLFFITQNRVDGQEYYDQMDRFLDSYHSENGLIDYFYISKNDLRLDSLYTAIGEMNLSGKDEAFLKAFYINAYNVIVIKQVVVFYPIKKPFDVNGFFDNIKNIVANKEYTLDELEKKIIIPTFSDPRIHFALVCAAMGCPAIQNKAFRPETIEEDLDRIAREVINNPYFVKYENGMLNLSKMFQWYASEFTAEGSVISYINQFRDEQIPESVLIEYNEYDWSLNEKR